MGWIVLAGVLALVSVLAGHFLAKEWYALSAIALAGLVAGTVVQASHSARDGDPTSDHLVGGCPAFNVYSQYQFHPYGTARWASPSPTAAKAPAFSENEVIAVDGWVRAQSPYETTNTPPWNADVWFHLADDSGWVTYAGVRSAPTQPAPEGDFAEGSAGVPLDPTCEGSYRQ